MIEIGNIGLFFDGGHKGDFDIYTTYSPVFRRDAHFNGVNVDCSGEIFKFLLSRLPFNGKINGERFLRNHEYLIKEAIKQQFRSHRRMVECYNCGVDCDNINVCIDCEGIEHTCCPPMNVQPDWTLVDTNDNGDISPDNFISVAEVPAISLKDFDLRSEYIYGLHMVCKIKSIKNPQVKKGKYYQDALFYDDNTSKVIEVELQDGVADYDKWNPNSTIEAWGVFKNGYFAVTSMELIEVDDSQPIIINRNDETPGYNDWRKSIINRDKNCVCCGHDKHLEAHHLFGYKENPNLAVNESNGVALCKFCHDKYHNIYGVKNINPVDFMNFIKRFGVR